MKILKYMFLVVTGVLFVFVEQSNGNMPPSLVELAEIEKQMIDPKFQKMQEELIMSGSDICSTAARDTIEAIRKDVQKFPVHVDSPLAVNASIEGIIDALKIASSLVREANKAIDNATEMVKAEDTKGASEAIIKGLRFDRELIFIAGVGIHDAQGFALSLAGSLALPALKNSIVSIQRSGAGLLESLEIAEKLSTDGIKIGGPAANKALNVARNIISTATLSAYNLVRKAATQALEGLQYATSKSINEVDILSGVISALKTQTSTDNSIALDAIARLNDGLQSVLSVSTKKPVIDALNMMYEGLKSTIIETEKAISATKDGLIEVGKLASQDPDAAVTALHNRVKLAEEQLLSAAAFGYLALGAAGGVSGKAIAEKLVPTVIEVQYGKAAAYEDLKLAERISLIGIRGGNSSSELGISTALQICDAAEIALFQDFVIAAEMAFKVFQKA